MGNAATKGAFRCPDCRKRFTTAQGLGGHRSRSHRAGTPVREKMREIAEPLREQLREIVRELAEIEARTQSLRQDRRDIERVLALLDNSPGNRTAVKAKTGGAAIEEAKKQAVREFIGLNADALGQGFTSAELNRMMKEDGFGPAMAPDKTKTFVQQLQGEGVVRADRIVKGGGMRYMVVGNGAS